MSSILPNIGPLPCFRTVLHGDCGENPETFDRSSEINGQLSPAMNHLALKMYDGRRVKPYQFLRFIAEHVGGSRAEKGDDTLRIG